MKVVVTGASGLFGADILKVFSKENTVMGLMGRKDLDLVNTKEVISYFDAAAPKLIIHSAGFRLVDDAERNPDMTYRINILGTKNIALAAAKLDIPMVYISSDSVFDGETAIPYNEFSRTNPVNVYGYSKLMGEEQVKTATIKFFIVRVPLLFGALGRKDSNYIYIMKNKMLAGEKLEYTTDQLCSPTYTKDAAAAIEKMVKTDYYGTYHICNEGIASRYDFYKKCAELMGLDTKQLVPIEQKEKLARRPKNTIFNGLAFQSTFGIEMRNWQAALRECIEEMS
ncbi:MAG: hypothetical protein APF77_07300 [Clostridia bacterium BRH_c25]|nr:MAG: hypothetical protein APF77_07300 [Clostridia bacterium BRH_c25]